MESLNDYIRTVSILGQAWGSQFASESSSDTAGEFGSNLPRDTARNFFLQFQANRRSDPNRPAVVVVEDNAGDVFLVKEAVTQAKLDLDLYFFRDGEVALRFFEHIDGAAFQCPDLLLLDLNLPKTNGFQVLSYLRRSERCASMPVVVMTSSSAHADRARMSPLNINEYFIKPSTYTEFLTLGNVIRKLV